MKILIAGLAKTGTTGLFHLLVNSLAEYTETSFEPRECPVEAKSASGNFIAKVIIMDNVDLASFSHFDKKITIVRDPRDRFISALLYSQFHAKYLFDATRVRMVQECLKRKERNPDKVSLREILEVMDKAAGNLKTTKNYPKRFMGPFTLFDNYIAGTKDTFLYKYEDFVAGEYASLEKYLGLPITGSPEVPTALARVVRTKNYGDWRNWFTLEDVHTWKPILEPWLEKYGYDVQDWKLYTEPAIQPAHCSEYFMRLVSERRASQAALADKSVTMQGRVNRATPAMVSGWAIGADPSTPVRVKLLVNGKELGQEMADKPRPGLKTRGIHPTGQCGFLFRFKPEQVLPVHSRVVIQPISEFFELGNSPCTVTEPVEIKKKTP